jgi:endo-1,4-beta-xylanase
LTFKAQSTEASVSKMRLLESSAALLAGATAVLGQNCPLPSTYRWKSSGILATPKNGNINLRDFTTAPYKGGHLVYATTQNATVWSSTAFGVVSDLSKLGSAPQTAMAPVLGSTISPSLFFFRPKNIWVLAYQWTAAGTFAYRTSTDPADVTRWSSEKPLFTGTITGSGTGPIDQAIIGDGKNMYLFFCGDNGKIYRASTPQGSFPGSFGNVSTIALSDTTANLFEAVQVYTINGQNNGQGRYLMIVEAFGPSTNRYFRSFTATSLDGTWTPQAATPTNPFASKDNTGVTWTKDISHGDIVRINPDQRNLIDPCNLQMLFQGRDPTDNSGTFSVLPYRPGLLTLEK